jgi:hypothetical protein
MASWISSETGVATVAAGLAEGVAAGDAEIMATFEGFSDTADLEVTAVGPAPATPTPTPTTPTPTPTTPTPTPPYVPPFNVPTIVIIVSLEIAPVEAAIEVGDSQQFMANATYSDNSVQDVTASATWSSTNTDVATIDSGLAAGFSDGNVTITATLGGLTSNEATLVVTGVPEPTVTPTPVITPSPAPSPSPSPTPTPSSPIEVTVESETIEVGEAVQFTATITYPDGSTADVTGEVTWTSSDTGVATVDAGLATGEGEGTAQITATIDGVTSDPITLTVTSPSALQWWVILAIVGALLVAGLLFFLLGRRRRVPKEEAA